MTVINRRTWLKGATASTLLASLKPLASSERPHWYLSGANNAKGEPYLLALSANGKGLYAWPLPGRAHDLALLPGSQQGFCVARRPGNWLYWFDLAQGKLLTRIESPPGSHFYGHAVTNPEGSLLYVTENHYQTPSNPTPRGAIGIYQTCPPFARIGELSSHGLGPHQLLYDATRTHLIVANGGNITHPSTDRDVLNLDTMAPNISYIEAGSGKLLEQRTPQDHQMSLRHLALGQNGLLAIGVQDQAPQRDPDAPMPLVLTHQRGQPLAALPASTSQWLQLNQYIASMAISPDGSAILASAPRANQLILWQHNSPITLATTDAAGITWDEAIQGFVASNSAGQLQSLIPSAHAQLKPLAQPALWQWDNHLFVS